MFLGQKGNGGNSKIMTVSVLKLRPSNLSKGKRSKAGWERGEGQEKGGGAGEALSVINIS